LESNGGVLVGTGTFGLRAGSEARDVNQFAEFVFSSE
jgi:hypothetical protein